MPPLNVFSGFSFREVVVEAYKDSRSSSKVDSAFSGYLLLNILKSQLLSTWSKAAVKSTNRTKVGFFILLVICCTLLATNIPSVVPLAERNPCCLIKKINFHNFSDKGVKIDHTHFWVKI